MSTRGQCSLRQGRGLFDRIDIDDQKEELNQSHSERLSGAQTCGIETHRRYTEEGGAAALAPPTVQTRDKVTCLETLNCPQV